MRKRDAFDVEKFNLWSCCGEWLASGILFCPKCGKQRIDPCSAGRNHAKPERRESDALDAKSEVAEALQGTAGRFHITIERHGWGTLDGDNFCGGAKQLRDTIAELLGKEGDSTADGLEFDYVQVKSKVRKMVVKIRRIE